ncbi:ABC transporter permease [Rhodococcus wratislaviensis]|uniref:ABC transporter permease n=1 Tax=Rhodococcus wratislaviensis TaxID=44752 RepID=UPI000F56A106|nr:ABC transporter permease [Rhodococcus wratislaviensis]
MIAVATRTSTERTSAETRAPGGAAAAVSRTTRDRLRLAGPSVVLVALVLLVALAEPNFLSMNALAVVSAQAVPILLLGLGQMFVILTGGIDLSVAALASLATVILATAIGSLGPLAVVVTLVALTLIGALTGLLIVFGQVPSFVVSLGALGFWGAVALVASGSTTIYISEGYDAIFWLSSWTVLGLPMAVWAGVAAVAAVFCAMRFSPRGNVFHLVGLGEIAAMMSGVRTRAVRVGAFALSGFFAGAAGIVLSAQQQSAAPQLADSLLLPAIAAVLVGGCAITGGIGGAWRVLVGALVVTVLRVGGSVAGIDPSFQQIVYGVVVIVAVAVTLDRSRLSIIK